ncbi:Ger(x)C family spore germination protein [Brevibacillus dissolubilis]|uniref:Ger(x)C family spore germination protein n=1 Tax=Brevibacillus dissolubilis TaxID=1844116 RepID=UPI0011160764|nr:Ger(x)C family spore germination protein [Brevibacillus dissolubilis]
MPKRRVACWITLAACLLTGCWDRREVNDVAFVVGSAADKEKDKYRTTLQIALPGQLGGVGSQGGGGGTSGNKPWFNASDFAETIRESSLEQQKSVSRFLYYAHRRTFMIGEGLARDGIEPIMDVLGRIPQNRMTAFVVISKGPGYRILNADAPIEKFPAEMIRELAVNSMKNPRTIKHVVNLILSDGIDLVLPIVSLKKSIPGPGEKGGKSTIELDGLAVFHQDKLTGLLSGKEAKGVLLGMGEATRPEITIMAPGAKGKITAVFPFISVKHQPVIQGDQITMKIQIRASGTIIENESNLELGRKHNLHNMEKVLAQTIKSTVESGIRKLQRKYNSDAIGFGKTIYNQLPKEWKRFSGRWDEMYPKVKVMVEVHTHIEHSGALIKPFGRRDRNIQK